MLAESWKRMKDAKVYGTMGAFLGLVAFPLADYLDGNQMTLKSAGLGAAVGAVVGTGAGMLINAAKNGEIEDYTVVAPLLGAGTTVAGSKMYNRSMSNKRLISNGLVGGTVGLALGGTIDYLT